MDEVTVSVGESGFVMVRTLPTPNNNVWNTMTLKKQSILEAICFSFSTALTFSRSKCKNGSSCVMLWLWLLTILCFYKKKKGSGGAVENTVDNVT